MQQKQSFQQFPGEAAETMSPGNFLVIPAAEIHIFKSWLKSSEFIVNVLMRITGPTSFSSCLLSGASFHPFQRPLPYLIFRILDISVLIENLEYIQNVIRMRWKGIGR